MQSTLFKLKQHSIILLLFLTFIASANDIGSIFIEDETRLNNVEDILLHTSISHATDDLSFGYINTEIFQVFKPDSIFDIKLPGLDQNSTLQIKKIDHNIEGVVTFSGQVIGIDHSTFIISKEENKVLGNIKLNGFSYNIEPTLANDNLHVINKMNRFKLLQDENDVLALDTNIKPNNHQTIRNPHSFTPLKDSRTGLIGSSDKIRVLFLYANDIGLSPNSLASNVVTEFNSIAKISGVLRKNRIESAGTPQLINSNFISDLGTPYSKSNILTKMEKRKAEFTDIDIRMKSVGADIAFLIIKADQDPGLERVGGLASDFLDSTKPFVVVADDYVSGDLTGVHEIGHILGGAHAYPVVDPDRDLFLKGHGIEGNNGLWQTIMGGYTQTCVFDVINGADQVCERIGYFSNPKIKPPTITNGQPIGHRKYANMVSVLDMTIPIVSQWGTYEEIIYTSPVMGFSFDPKKNGHGIHISQSGSIYYLYFYSYDQNGEPEWFIGQSTLNNNQLSGILERVEYNSITDELTTITAGSFSLNYGIEQINNNTNCNGVNRSLQPGAFNWNIDGQSGQWCMRPLFTTDDPDTDDDIDESNRPSATYFNSGLWYQPAQGGWGMSVQVDKRIDQISKISFIDKYQTYAITYYYDSSGVGRWASGSSGMSTSSTVFDIPEMYHTYGYPRNIDGTFQNTDIGDLYIDFGSNTADINLIYPITPGGSLSRNNVVIDNLTQ